MMLGFGGDFGSDMATNGAIGRANVAETRAEQATSIANQWKDQAEEMTLHHAGNLGVRFALSTQLQRADPENPLLRDELLIERIKTAARAGFELKGRDFEGARDVGRTFAIPGRGPKRLLPPEIMRNDPETLKLAYAGAAAQRHALMAELRRLDPKNPLLIDKSLIERIRSAGEAAYKIAGENFAAAREVGDTFSVPRG